MSGDGSEYDDAVNDAYDASELLEKPDIDDWLTDYSDEWVEAWDALPGGMTDGQIEAFIDILWDLDLDEWDIEAMYEDFWDWWGEHYGEAA